MKKKNLKINGLKLNKKAISNLKVSNVKGGSAINCNTGDMFGAPSCFCLTEDCFTGFLWFC
jgi:hypothetical protein